MQGQAFFDFHRIAPCPGVKYATGRVFDRPHQVKGQLSARCKGKKVNLRLQRSTFPTYTAAVSFNFCHSAVPTTLLNPSLTFGSSLSFPINLSLSISISSRRIH